MKIDSPKYNTFKLWYTSDAKLVGSHRLPQLRQQNHVPRNIRSWNERNQLKKLGEHWLDFFIDDYHFDAFWSALVGCVEADSPDVEKF